MLAILPIFFSVGLLMTPDAPLIACWSGTLYFLYRALIEESRHAWLGVGVCLGLGMLSKYTIALLGPAALLFMVMDPRSRRWFLKPDPYIAACIGLALFSPVIAWNFDHEWASFIFQGPRRVAGGVDFSLHELIGSILVLLTPTGFAAAVSLLFFRKSCRAGSSLAPIHSKSRSYTFSLVLLLVPLSVFLTFSLSKPVKLNWTGPLWLSLMPFIAHYMAPETGIASRRLAHLVQRAWPATIAASLLIYAASLHYLSLGIPGIPYPENFPLVGGSDLGQQIEQIENDIELASGVEPLVVGMDKYRTASLLAFYRPELAEDKNGLTASEGVAETSGCHLFGGNSLMYRYWFPEKVNENRLMILVSPQRADLDKTNVRSRISQMGDVQELVIQTEAAVGKYLCRRKRI